MATDPAPRFAVMALEEIETVLTPAAMVWRPVRAALGVRAFGVNSFAAAEAGRDVIEPHTETDDGRGHEELYFVVRGSARFTLDGDSFDVPSGTFVFVRDPDVHRHAIANESGTEVLAFGGDPVFRPSGAEWMWRVRPLLPDQLGPAQAIADAGLAELPESPGVWYSQALVAAAGDQPEQAREWLSRAVEREPRLLDEARRDQLLADVIDDVDP
jgi:hypothetical protein